jgi:hypothetical protein
VGKLMHRRNFIQLGAGAAAATVALAHPAIKPYDGYQAFLDSIGHKVHKLVLSTGRPMESVMIEGRLDSLNLVDYYRLVRIHLDGGAEHRWFEKVTYL